MLLTVNSDDYIHLFVQLLALSLKNGSKVEKSEKVRQVKVHGSSFAWSYVVRCGFCNGKFQLRPDGDTDGRVKYFESRKFTRNYIET